MTIGSVSINVSLEGIEALLGSIGKGPTNTGNPDPVVNEVSVLVADPTATTSLDGVAATDADSITVYGRTGRQIVTILASTADAGRLAEYLVRPSPVYWFSAIEVFLNPLDPADRDLVAELDVGAQITISKRFPAVTNPVVQTLFVEGVEHRIERDGHTVTLYTSPASFYEPFELGLSTLGDPAYGLG